MQKGFRETQNNRKVTHNDTQPQNEHSYKETKATTKRHKRDERTCEELKRESSKDKRLQRDAKQPQRHNPQNKTNPGDDTSASLTFKISPLGSQSERFCDFVLRCNFNVYY